ncbi:hypothetical protein [Streptomyces sp. B15]|uniref:hypothetical protein n=1 Tax=Streptomyces sp. B15 TaxID=1537797 RepID=UPI001B358DD9|nr:hypothetical protein [Streptomyces sp. B15]MBQ1123753.1 hypothetical protein [Streptomyces sp. B15]
MAREWSGRLGVVAAQAKPRLMEELMRRVFPTPGANVGEARSPLGELDEAFLALGAAAARPLTMPLLSDDGRTKSDWPVDRVRARLAHPGATASQRALIWHEVVRRAQKLPEPWQLVAVGMTIPVLYRMLRRQQLPQRLERPDLEQTALAAVATTLPLLTSDHPEPHRALFNAADREIHRLVNAARKQERHECPVLISPDTPAPERPDVEDRNTPDHGEERDEYAVLAAAMQAGVLKAHEAQLIALTRLEKKSVKDIAQQRGHAWRTLYRHRAAAETHLAVHLQRQAYEV